MVWLIVLRFKACLKIPRFIHYDQVKSYAISYQSSVNEAFQIVIKIWGHNTELVMVNFLYRDSLDLAFKYFTSSTLTVRLAGLSQITVSNCSFEEVLHVTCRYTVTCYMHATVPQTKCTFNWYHLQNGEIDLVFHLVF